MLLITNLNTPEVIEASASVSSSSKFIELIQNMQRNILFPRQYSRIRMTPPASLSITRY
jgi:hypothetical protein